MNYGAPKPIIKNTDWKVTGESGIKYKEVCNDWTSYLPTYESQVGMWVATQACSIFSCLNVIETQLKQQGMDINFSDRFTAKMCGNTMSGSQLTTVLYSLTHDGWLLEEDWPFDLSKEGKVDWNEYYKEIPQTLKDKAKKNLEDAKWEIRYEWINLGNCQPDLEYLKTQLKHAPLQIATSFGSKMCISEHAMMLYKIDDYIYVYDSYENGTREFSLDYPLPWIMKIVVQTKTIQSLIIPPIINNLYYGMRNNQEVKYMQEKLIKLGYLSKGLNTGNYFNLTQLAVRKFQWDYRVASIPVLLWNNGKYVYFSTRNKLNLL
jgi:hypothetical protein